VSLGQPLVTLSIGRVTRCKIFLVLRTVAVNEQKDSSANKIPRHSSLAPQITRRVVPDRLMLRSVFPRAHRVDSFVCWQCRVNTYRTAASDHKRRTAKATQRSSAQYAASIGTSALPGIREYLKQWQIHTGANIIAAPSTLRTTNHRTDVANSRDTGPSYNELAIDGGQSEEDFDNFRPFLKDDLVEVGGQRTFLLPGDMVELV
jgi:hypothetical protein